MGIKYDKNGNIQYQCNNVNGKGKGYEFGKIKFEGQYVIGKRNEKGIEYNYFSYIIYEGEYLNCQRNGKGKEYFKNGKLKFEGEYLNNKIWQGIVYNNLNSYEFEIINGNGKIIEFDDLDKKIFFDEYLNGQRNGKGKEYDDNGKLKFEGEYLNGLRNGKGKEYDDNGKLIFEGEY